MSRATLARHGRITQTQPAALLAIEPPTPKRQVDALVAGGFLERRSQQGDKRKNALVLTPAGCDSAIVAFPHQLRHALLEGIAPDDPDRAVRVLNQIARTIDRLDRP